MSSAGSSERNKRSVSLPAGKTMHRIALTGASGMLGQAILRCLVGRQDISVLALYRQSPSELNARSGRRSAPSLPARNIATATCDLTRAEEFADVLKRFDPTAVIHAAATGMQIPRPDVETLTEINVHLPVRLTEVVSELPDCSFIHVSSGLAYKDQGRPLREEDPLDTKHPYGASKAEAETQLREVAERSDLPLTVVRPFSFTGPGDFGTRLFPSLLGHAAEQKKFAMSTGDQVRDHSSVDDIAAGVTAAALLPTVPRKSQLFNLGAGDTRTLRELVTSVIDQLSLNVEIEFGARPHAGDEPMFVVPDMTHTREVLHWQTRENIAYAVWRLARESFPSLKIREPNRIDECD
jgi:nucleoside-diphosphate-sugar epimerase